MPVYEALKEMYLEHLKWKIIFNAVFVGGFLLAILIGYPIWAYRYQGTQAELFLEQTQKEFILLSYEERRSPLGPAAQLVYDEIGNTKDVYDYDMHLDRRTRMRYVEGTAETETGRYRFKVSRDPDGVVRLEFLNRLP